MSEQRILYLAEKGVGVIVGKIARQVEDQPEVADVAPVAVALRDGRHQHPVGDEDDGDDRDDRIHAMIQRPPEHSLVIALAAGDQLAGFGIFLFRQVGGGQGDQHQGHEERAEQGKNDRQSDARHVKLESADLILHEQDRGEDRHRGQGGHDDRQVDLAGPGDGGVAGRLAHGTPAVDVLQHHDAVVHHHAHADHQSHHGDGVEGPADEVDHHQGDQHREGDGNHHDQGHAQVAQEKHQDQDGEHPAPQGGIGEVVDRIFDELPFHEQDVDVGFGKHWVSLELFFQQAAYLVSHFYRVRQRFLLDLQQQGWLAVDPLGPAAFFHVVFYFGDILHPQAKLVDRKLLDLLQVAEAGDGAHDEFFVAVVHPSGRHCEIVVTQAVDHLEHVQAVGLDLVLVDQYLDAFLLGAPDLNARDPVNPFQGLLEKFFHDIIRIFYFLREGEGHEDDRSVVAPELSQIIALKIIRQLGAGPFHTVAQLVVGHIHIRAPGKLQPGPAAVAVAVGLHLAHSRDGAHLLFHRPGNLLFHLLRVGIDVGDPYPQERRSEALGQQFDHHLLVGDRPHHHDGQQGNDDGDRPPHGQVGQEGFIVEHVDSRVKGFLG